MPAYEQRDFSGVAVETILTADITNTDATFVVTNPTGWPAGGANGPFFVQIDTEVVYVASRTGQTCTVATNGRGADGTSASQHSAGVPCKVIVGKTDFYEANKAVSGTIGKIVGAEDLLVGQSANQLKRVAPGISGNVLQILAGLVAWGAIPANSIGPTQLQNDSVTALAIAPGAVNTSEQADGSVTTVKLSNNAVTPAKVDVSVAGDGLTGGNGTALALAPDNSTVELNGDILRVKASGITANELAADSVGDSELANVVSLAHFLSTVRPITLSTTAPSNPVAGDWWWDTDNYGLFEYTTATTSWQPPWNLPWGQLTSDSSTTASATTTGAPVATDLSITWTAIAGRRYEVCCVGHYLSSALGDTVGVDIDNGAGSARFHTDQIVAKANFAHAFSFSYIEGAVSGSQTRRLTVDRTDGSGNCGYFADSERVGYLWVKDIGFSANPT